MDNTLNLVIRQQLAKELTEFTSLFKNSQDLCVQNNVLLKNDKVVLPETFYIKTISLVHQNHWGTEKTKHKIRESFWWLKMNNDVEDLIKACPFCQAVTPSSQFEPLNPIYMPSHSWEYLHADICGPFPTGEYIYTVIDA